MDVGVSNRVTGENSIYFKNGFKSLFFDYGQLLLSELTIFYSANYLIYINTINLYNQFALDLCQKNSIFNFN